MTGSTSTPGRSGRNSTALDRGEFAFALAPGQRSWSRGGRAGTRRGPATAVLRVRWTAFQRDGVSGIDHGAGGRGQRAAGPAARSFALRVEHDLTFQWQIVEGPGALAGMHNLSRHLPGVGRARPHACEGHGAPARRCLRRRRIDHRHSRTDGGNSAPRPSRRRACRVIRSSVPPEGPGARAEMPSETSS